MFFRAESKGLLLIPERRFLVLPATHYDGLCRFLHGEPLPEKFPYSEFLGEERVRSQLLANAAEIEAEMVRSLELTPIPNAYIAPLTINMELTTRCPLGCPQCYCDLKDGKDLPLERALDVVKEAKMLRIPRLNLSGGETMLHPHLYELIAAGARAGMTVAVALSGYGVNEESTMRLLEAGVSEIYVSLNGSTRKISSITRNGYDLAIRSLELFRRMQVPFCAVNWVAHRSNIEDFPAMVQLCEDYGIERLMVLAFKPDSSHSMSGAPDAAQFFFLADWIKQYRRQNGRVLIEVEHCYSSLRAWMGQSFWGNRNVGINKGCGAGREGISLDVDGNFTPCRHLEHHESYERIEDYWKKSPVLERLRNVEKNPKPPCDRCSFVSNCLSCLAVNDKLNGSIVKSNPFCALLKD